MATTKLNKEFKDNKKLSTSKYASEVLKLIETLSVKPTDQILSFIGDIKGFKQSEFNIAIEAKNKSLDEFGKYVYFIAEKHKADRMYGMGPLEMSENIVNYFTNNLDKGWIKKIEDEIKSKEVKDKLEVESKEYAKAAKAKAKEDVKFLKTFKLDTATQKELERYSDIKTIDIKSAYEEEDKLVLFGQAVTDKIRAIIVASEAKPIKAIKKAKKAVKKDISAEQITFASLFD